MRRWLPVLLLVGAGAALGYGQALDNPKIVERLQLTPAEVTRLEEIRERIERTVREARLEIRVLQASIKRLLFDPQVDLKEVEGLLRRAMEWELKLRMAQVTGQVEARRLLGDERWGRLNALTRAKERARERAGADAGGKRR